MAIIWFSDEDRQRLRQEEAERVKREELFWEFVCQEEPFRVASREPLPFDVDRMAMLDIRPWPEAER